LNKFYIVTNIKYLSAKINGKVRSIKKKFLVDKKERIEYITLKPFHNKSV